MLSNDLDAADIFPFFHQLWFIEEKTYRKRYELQVKNDMEIIR
jgi:hypothetical protein